MPWKKVPLLNRLAGMRWRCSTERRQVHICKWKAIKPQFKIVFSYLCTLTVFLEHLTFNYYFWNKGSLLFLEHGCLQTFYLFLSIFQHKWWLFYLQTCFYFYLLNRGSLSQWENKRLQTHMFWKILPKHQTSIIPGLNNWVHSLLQQHKFSSNSFKKYYFKHLGFILSFTIVYSSCF